MNVVLQGAERSAMVESAEMLIAIEEGLERGKSKDSTGPKESCIGGGGRGGQM